MIHNLSRNVGLMVLVQALLATPAAAGHRMSFASTEFAANSVAVDCSPFGSCVDSQFDLDGQGGASCATDGGVPPHCSGNVSTEATGDAWAITTQLTYWGPPYEAPGGCASTGMTAEATYAGPDSLELHWVIDAFVCDASVQLDVGAVELSVFRYSGDPAQFEGIYVESVDQLVKLGLIQPEDILFSEVKLYDVEDDVGVFEYLVDVTGVPSEEIVVFAAEGGIAFTSRVATPTTSAWGVAWLVVVLLSVATWSLRRGAFAADQK